MTFTSIFFLFGFLPFGTALYFLWKNKTWKLVILFCLSLFFIVWNDPTHLPLLAIAILFNYIFGNIIGKYVEKENYKTANNIVRLAVIANLLLLITTKYTHFITEIFNSVLQLSIIPDNNNFPLGISYFCFTSISYLMDVYWGSIKPETNILKFSTYNLMFPKFLQGPITRYKTVGADLAILKPNLDDILSGIRRFVLGLAKKVLIADKIAIATNKIFESDFRLLGADLAWLGLIAFAIQIYLDFSGYTDMAIGLGLVFGIRLPENFQDPYGSKSITEFWRRWHISLTSWFRKYVFQPLEFSRREVRFNSQQVNILIVFFLTGLWHGANWNFVIWGVYFGIILAIEAGQFGKTLKLTPQFFQYFYSIFLILIGWIFFRIEQFNQWPQFFLALSGLHGWTNMLTLRYLNIAFYLPHIFVGLLTCLPNLSSPISSWSVKYKIIRFLSYLFLLILFVLSISSILANGFSPFEYQQF